jgi:arylsulfatase A-like enzyme
MYLSSPSGVSREIRRKTMDAINKVNQEAYEEAKDPETLTRISQYEMAFRMQIHANEAFDIKNEPDYIHKMYGTEPGKESFANNCLLARRLAERGTRYIQLFHWGWDAHGAGENEALNAGFKRQCEDTDKAVYALITDLKQRGLLDDTLIVWGGEFGRTPMRENRGGQEMKLIGRDHNPGAFTMWMAGAGAKPGSFGETDPIGYRAVKDKVSVQDLQATILNRLGFNHKQLVYPFNGLDQTLTGVTHPSRYVKELFL